MAGEIHKIDDFAPKSVETGVGLALRDSTALYWFFTAGSRHICEPGELFYAGIGGHRNLGESCLQCAHREAMEEMGTSVIINSSAVTWFIPRRGDIKLIDLSDRPCPLALYEMVHPPNTPKAGELYQLVIYQAEPIKRSTSIPRDEVSSIIALTKDQVILGVNRKISLSQLLKEGGSVIFGGDQIDRSTLLYPIGTAWALGQIFQHLNKI